MVLPVWTFFRFFPLHLQGFVRGTFGSVVLHSTTVPTCLAYLYYFYDYYYYYYTHMALITFYTILKYAYILQHYTMMSIYNILQYMFCSGQALFHTFVTGSQLLSNQLPWEHTGQKTASRKVGIINIHVSPIAIILPLFIK